MEAPKASSSVTKGVFEDEEFHFPWLHACINALVLHVNAFALFNVFPYAGYMVVWFGKTKDKDQVGYYAGFLLSAFMIGRSISSLFWGLIADHKGRKFVIYIGCSAMIVFQVLFGLSPTFELAVLCRVLLGLFNGLVGTAKTVASELCPHHRTDMQGKAMGIASAGVSIATLLGPSIGGWLAEPAVNFPGSVLDTALTRQFPYLLPNLVAAFISSVALLLAFFFLPETLNHTPKSAAAPPNQWTGKTQADEPIPAAPPPATLSTAAATSEPSVRIHVQAGEEAEGKAVEAVEQEGKCAEEKGVNKAEPGEKQEDEEERHKDQGGARGVCAEMGAKCRGMAVVFKDRLVLSAVLVYSFHSFVSIMMSEVIPLWMMSTRGVGGLDLSASAIGTVGSIVGGCLIAYQLFLYPKLIKRSKPLELWVYCTLFVVASTVFIPFIPSLFPIRITEGVAAVIDQTNSTFSISSSPISPSPAATAGTVGAGGVVDSSAALVATTVFRGIQMAMEMTIFTSSFLAINNSCHSSQRGVVNGLGMTVASFAKAIGPLIGGSMFAWSASEGAEQGGPFGIYFAFFVCAVLWLLQGVYVQCLMPKQLNSMRTL